MHRQVGDKVEVKGPFPKIAYTANMKKKIGMIAGGTGITPMLQVGTSVPVALKYRHTFFMLYIYSMLLYVNLCYCTLFDLNFISTL
jgi:predicted ferric reductase